jgi:putative membrane protein
MTVALLPIAILYSIGWLRLSKSLPKVLSRWRLGAFVGGIAAIWLAADSPLSHLDHHLLTAHMMRHLVLMLVAAPLLLFSAPSIVLLHAFAEPFVRDTLSPFLRTRTVHRLGLICSHPAFCWLAGVVTVIVWHVPRIFDLARESHHWHEIEQVCFLVAGLFFWWPVVCPWPAAVRTPHWSVPLYLFLATLPCDALSAFLVFCDHVVYRSYLSNGGALQDQSLAGALMWVTVTFAYLVPAVVVMVQLLSGRSTQPAEVQSRFS